MEIHERASPVEGVRLLALDGGLDHTTTGEFIRRMDTLLAEGDRHVVLDLSELSYSSSLGLSALVRVHHHFAAHDGRIAFASLHTGIATILRVARLDRLFDLFDTVEEAARRIGPKADGTGQA